MLLSIAIEDQDRVNNIDNIQIVMVNTSHPGNIGAAARVMKNMYLHTLSLVDPVCYPHANATAMASGADDVLATANVYADLPSALHASHLVIATSARNRRLSIPCLTPQACAKKLYTEAQNGTVSLLFGRERTGLTNEELGYCHYLVEIPANPAYRSLNIASAIQIMSYEIMQVYLQAQDMAEQVKRENKEVLASGEDIERFYQHLEQVLIKIQFLYPERSPQLIRRLRRLFNRIHLEQNEVNILRGILTAIEKQ